MKVVTFTPELLVIKNTTSILVVELKTTVLSAKGPGIDTLMEAYSEITNELNGFLDDNFGAEFDAGNLHNAAKIVDKIYHGGLIAFARAAGFDTENPAN